MNGTDFSRVLLAAAALGMAAPASRADMMADSPVEFPEKGALPARFPPDVKVTHFPAEPGYVLCESPCRSLAQIAAIRREMPAGEFTVPPTDRRPLQRSRRLLESGGKLHVLGLGDSIVNDTMRSGWLAKLAEAFPDARIRGTVYVRGGGGCQHFREEQRIRRVVVPLQPDLVLIGGISQQGVEPIREVIHQLRDGLPEVEILLATGAFGTADPRRPAELTRARHSGTGDYGRELRALAAETRCAFLDMTGPWAGFIRSSGVHPHRFYRDRVHANEFGEQILARILLEFFHRGK
jgi:lysophospholipase L1-like esterase